MCLTNGSLANGFRRMASPPVSMRQIGNCRTIRINRHAAPYCVHIGGIVMYRVDKATFQVLFGSRSPGMPAYVDDPVISTKEIADDD